jgi:Uma2 family endonuclease
MALTAQQLAEQMPDGRQLLSDEPEMESSIHYQQLALLVSSLEWHWQDREDFFIGANLTVYYDHQQLRRRAFRGPDFFVVRDVSGEPRSSWVVWEEGGRYPDLIIELLSESTASVDRTDKKALYQNIFRTPEYFWFSPITGELAGFRLIERQYQPIPGDEQGRRWSQVLGLYLGVKDERLRYFTAEGQLIASPAEAAAHETQRAEHERERAEHERERAEHERERAEHERERAERLAQRLRDLGIDPAEAAD